MKIIKNTEKEFVMQLTDEEFENILLSSENPRLVEIGKKACHFNKTINKNPRLQSEGYELFVKVGGEMEVNNEE